MHNTIENRKWWWPFCFYRHKQTKVFGENKNWFWITLWNAGLHKELVYFISYKLNLTKEKTDFIKTNDEREKVKQGVFA